MKLYACENNPETLKVILAGKLSNRQFEVEFVTGDQSSLKFPKRLPQLVLDSGIVLFSSNSAAEFLYGCSSKNTTAINYYLDLEATVIQPLTANITSKADNIKSKSDKVLNDLDSKLSSSKYLTGEEITVADVSIWSSLYPLATDAKQNETVLKQRTHLKQWFDRIHQLPQTPDAIKSSRISSGISSLANLLLTHWFPIVNTQKAFVLHQDSKTPESPIKESVAVDEAEIEVSKSAWLGSGKEKVSPKPKVHPVLPVPGERNILITSALPYVNNVPHLGNIIGCVLSGDVFGRYCRLRNYNTIYICGTDEYGTATETKALEEGLTPKEICDKYFKIHDAIYKWFNLQFDFFGRTTTPEQTEICQDIFLKLNQKGFILSDSVEQLLCEKCDRYLADRFVEGTCPHCAYDDARGDQCDGCGHLINAVELIKPRCKVCQQTPVVRYSKQFFLDLPKIEPKLKEWMTKSAPGWSHNAREIAKAWVNDGLKPRCITRDLKWGIPVPLKDYQNKVFYVWFDAPIGYISMTKQYTDKWKKWWLPDEGTDVALYQFMAKDNVPFHSVMFPACLLGTGEKYTILSHLFATEYLNYEDGKFSKSRGVGVFGTDAQDTGIPADIWRFYLLYVRPESQDSSFSWLDLAMKNNSELLNILGNFINRALVFAEKFFDSKVPEMNLLEEDFILLALINRELNNYISDLEKGKLREGIRHTLSIARIGNQLMQASQPWVLYKGTEKEKERCATVIGFSVNLSCLLSVLVRPYMPETSEVIQKQLDAPDNVYVIRDKFSLLLKPGHQLGKPSPLFNKIEIPHIEKMKEQFSGRQKSKTPDGTDRVEKTRALNPELSDCTDVATLEAAVAAQGDLVRKMKSSGKEKSEWQPEVAKLLDLKKKLATAQANAKSSPSPAKDVKDVKPTGTQPDGADVAALEAAVAAQGDLVRKMKSSGKEKSEWQPEVAKLLDLKKKLATAQANAKTSSPAEDVKDVKPPSDTQNGPKSGDVQQLEAAIAEQGNVVRKLKESGVDRSQWQPELNKLLDLKKQLAELQGEPAAAKPTGKKSKKK